jgi:murein DD-endopeptidase MepM/ murein hydrolase activator NlpD
MAATTADRVVTEIVADTSGHDPKIRTSAQVIDQFASTAERSANRAESAIRTSSTAMVQSAGAARAGYQQLGFQISDVIQSLVSGVNPAVVFGQQASQFAQAIGMISQAGQGAQGGIGALKEDFDEAKGAMEGAKGASEKLAVALGADSAAAEGNSVATGTDAAAKQGQANASRVSTGATEVNTVALGTNTAATEVNAVATTGLAAAKGRLVQFLTGPWGAAFIGAITVLGLFGSRIGSASSELDKATDKLKENARQTELSRLAKEIFARTIEGNVAAIRAETEALEAQNRSLIFNQFLTKANAEARLARARADLATIEGELAAARETLRERQRMADGLGPDQGFGPQQALVTAERRIAELTAAALAQREAIASAERQTRLAQGAISTTLAESAVDPLRRINLQYDVMAQNARNAAAGNDALTRSLTRTLTAIEARRQADLRAEQARQAAQRQSARDSGRDLQRPVSGGVLSPFGADRSGVALNGRNIPGRRHQGVDLVGRIGDPVVAPQSGTVTVGNRNGGLGIYVEIRGADGSRDILGHLSGADVRNGQRVEAGQLVGRVGDTGNARGGPPHLHWQRNENGQWVDPMRSTIAGGGAASAAQAADRAAAAAERQRLENERNEATFQAELGRQNEALLQARRRNVATVEEQVRLEIDQINAARDRQNASYDADVIQGRMTQARADQLKALNNQTAIEDSRTVQIREQQRLDQQRYQIAVGDLRDAMSIEQARGQLASTVAERFASELRLLDLSRQAELAAIQNLRDDARRRGELNAATDAAFDRQAAAVNERYSLERERINRENEGPRARYMRELRARNADIGTQLEELDVRAMQALDESAQSAIKSVLGLHGALGDIIADLVMIFIRKQALSLFDGSGSGGGFGGILGALGIGGGASKGIGDTAAVFDVGALIKGSLGFANGGRPPMGRISIVGERGPELFVPDQPGTIVPQGRAISFQGGAALGASGASQGVARVQIELSGDIDGRIASVSGPVAVEIVRRAAPEIAASAKAETLRAVTRPRLNRG